MRGHARHAQTFAGSFVGLIIFTAKIMRVGDNRLATDFVKRDVLRRMARRRGNWHGREHPLGMARRPFQRLHAAHRAAQNTKQTVDAKMVDQQGLRTHHIADGQHRKICAIGARAIGLLALRPGRARATADDVRANNEISIGVDNFASADEVNPPTGFAAQRIFARDVLVHG